MERTEIRINDLVKGVAIDSNGGAHKFVYHNSSTETILPSGLTTISMNDSFDLTGPGPHYSVTFNWRWTYTPPESSGRRSIIGSNSTATLTTYSCATRCNSKLSEVHTDEHGAFKSVGVCVYLRTILY